VSTLSVEGGPFFDRAADGALFTALRSSLASHVERYELDTDVNDPEFATAMAARLDAFMGGRQ
jgi:uncharacterized protein (UPF0261 family)